MRPDRKWICFYGRSVTTYKTGKDGNDSWLK